MTRHFCKFIAWAYPGFEAYCSECDWTSGRCDTVEEARGAAYRHLYGVVVPDEMHAKDNS